MPRAAPELPSLDTIRQILRGETPKQKGMRPTGRYFVSAATFQGLLLCVKDGAERVEARATGELSFDYEGRCWTVVRSTAIKKALHVEHEL
jgi:hypothetical protein